MTANMSFKQIIDPLLVQKYNLKLNSRLQDKDHALVTPSSQYKSTPDLKIILEAGESKSHKNAVELNISVIEFAENHSHMDFVNTNIKKKDIYSSSEKLRKEPCSEEKTKVNDSIVQELQLLNDCEIAEKERETRRERHKILKEFAYSPRHDQVSDGTTKIKIKDLLK